MILEIDAGNSRMKWRILDSDGRIICAGAHSGVVENLSMLPDLPGVNRARVSSVRSEKANATLARLIHAATGILPEFAKSQKVLGSVTNGYSEFEKLGVDRWMAMLAGRDLAGQQAYVVLDAGSAITLDFVDQSGLHRGGYIVPGIHMQEQILLCGTAIEFSDEFSGGSVVPGRSTAAAIRNGIMAMVSRWVVGEVSGCDLELKKVLLTGGDAPILSTGLSSVGLRHILVPDLVLDGLKVSLP